MPFYDDDDDDRLFYKNKLLISAGRRSAFEETMSYRDRNEYATTKIKYDSEIKFKSSSPLYTPSESDRVTSYKDYTPKISPYNHEYKVSSEIANKDDNDFKIEAKARGLFESDINGVKSKFEADCSGLFDKTNNIFRIDANARGMSESNTDGVKVKIENDCSGSWDIINNDYKIEAKAKGMIESDIDGATAKIEAGCSGLFENKEEKFGVNYKSSIQKDDTTFFHSEGSAEVGLTNGQVKLSSTLFSTKNEDVNFKFLSATAESKFGINKDGIDCIERAGLNLMEIDGEVFKSKVGINLDTGVSVNDGTIEVKLEGIGFKLGKETGLSTPIGDFTVNLEKLFS